MKVCFVGPANSTHIIKWCNWFSNHGHDIHVISFTPGEIENVQIHLIANTAEAGGSDFSKLKYLFTGKKIRDLIAAINPDIINAHYATSYGTAIALSGVKKYVLSVWGSDIYEFPQKSYLHRLLLQFSLHRAGLLFSTSKAMAVEAAKYTKRKFEITPFGVDMDLFNPDKRTRDDDQTFVIGTVKTMSDNYGINTILEAASIIKNERPDVPLLVRLAGSGPQLEEYKNLSEELDIIEITSFLGQITQQEAATEWANMDIAVIPSLHESFGVAAIEAQACGVPVIITKAPGLMETTMSGKTSIVVNFKDPDAVAEAVCTLYDNKEKLKKMGELARSFAEREYELNNCFNKIVLLYENVINEKLRLNSL